MDNDHRVLGRRLGLFDTSADIGAGLPLWLPHGADVRTSLEQFAAEIAQETGCRRVYTPVLARRSLFERSGHWDKFAADMFPAMRVGGDELVLRPANCPSHVQVYAAEPHSWRDLPVRLTESAAMFRSELTGVLGGLSRVRQISLDDAHVFCRPDQVVAEVVTAVDAILRAYDVLDIEISYIRLSGRDPREASAYAGSDEDWRASEQDLLDALDQRGLPHRRGDGEAAFYGPKIDVQVIDAAGRELTLSTVQVDRVLPARFDLRYTDAHGRVARPVMVHRGLIGSMERLVALLIERYEGRFPTWLAPVPLALAPVRDDRHGAQADAVAERFRAAGIRVEVARRGSLGSRVRGLQERRVPRVAVLGDREAAEDHLSVNGKAVAVDDLITGMQEEIRRRSSVFLV